MTVRYVTGTSSGEFTLSLRGPTFRHGTGVPLDSLGKDGDLYARLNTGEYYSRFKGRWFILAPDDDFQVETIARGEDLVLDADTKLVTIYRNPYTIDTHDISADSMSVTSDRMPSHDHTGLSLPSGVEGQTLTIKDVSGHYTAFEVRIQGSIDNVSLKVMQEIAAKMELIYTAGSWRVVSR